MKVIKAGHQILTPESVTKHIERIARVCYKSEDKISEGTDIKMVRSLINRQHMAMLEHSSICVEVDALTYYEIWNTVDYFRTHTFESSNRSREKRPERMYLRMTDLKVCDDREMCAHDANGGTIRYLISGNIRAWYEAMVQFVKHEGFPMHVYTVLEDATGGPEGVFKYMDRNDPNGEMFTIYDVEDLNERPRWAKLVPDITVLTPGERWIHEDISVLFQVDRGVTHEMVRMRDCSFAQESTRYCNYSNGKFGSEITVIEPCFWKEGTLEYHEWYESCLADERRYVHLVNDLHAQPQQARTVLPQSTKAEIVMTTNLREWWHILNLRACDTTGPAHPQMKEVMVPLLKDFLANPEISTFFGDLKLPA